MGGKCDPCCDLLALKMATNAIAIVTIVYWTVFFLLILTGLCKARYEPESFKESIVERSGTLNDGENKTEGISGRGRLLCDDEKPDCPSGESCIGGRCRVKSEIKCDTDKQCRKFPGHICVKKTGLCGYQPDIEKAEKKALKPVIMALWFMLSIAVIGHAFGIVLFFGAKNENSCAILTWIIVAAILSLLTFLSVIIIGVYGIMFAVISIVVAVYFIIVVFLFYRELKRNKVNPDEAPKEDISLERQPSKESGSSTESEKLNKS